MKYRHLCRNTHTVSDIEMASEIDHCDWMSCFIGNLLSALSFHSLKDVLLLECKWFGNDFSNKSSVIDGC